MKHEEKMMRKVFQLARMGAGKVAPNPMVGAIICRDEKIISSGFHSKYGQPHAEADAISKATEALEGSTIYVNLEPCNHFGKTPPCTGKIIEAGIKKVVVSNLDPNPLVAGMGIEKLRSAGIEVELGVLEEEGNMLNEAFFKYIREKVPFVVMKSASSLDGKISTETGQSQWITNEESRLDGHSMRNDYQGILVGIDTVLADDPRLDCRIEGGENPFRIILDSRLRIPLDSKILKSPDKEKNIVFTSQMADQGKIRELEEFAKVFVLKDRPLDLKAILKTLGQEGISSILVEGGGRVHGSFIKENLIDKYYFYFAPILIGGDHAPGFFRGNGFGELGEIPKLEIRKVDDLGGNLRITCYPERS